MQKLAMEDMQRERQAAEERLQEAVRQTEQLWQQKLDEAVLQARQEEQESARQEAERVAK